jgi:hypothetical protein
MDLGPGIESHVFTEEKKMKTRLAHCAILALVILALAGAGVAEASPVTYKEQFTGSGSLGAQTFADALVTITFLGDTDNIVGSLGLFTDAIGTANLTVAGLGTATFTDQLEAFDNQGFGVGAAGISLGTSSVLDTLNSVFATYDLQTSIGPVTGSSFIRPDLTFNTDLGGFNLSSGGNSTFTAVVMPEPVSLTLFSLGLAGIAGRKWLRKRANR